MLHVWASPFGNISIYRVTADLWRVQSDNQFIFFEAYDTPAPGAKRLAPPFNLFGQTLGYLVSLVAMRDKNMSFATMSERLTLLPPDAPMCVRSIGVAANDAAIHRNGLLDHILQTYLLVGLPDVSYVYCPQDMLHLAIIGQTSHFFALLYLRKLLPLFVVHNWTTAFGRPETPCDSAVRRIVEVSNDCESHIDHLHYVAGKLEELSSKFQPMQILESIRALFTPQKDIDAAVANFERQNAQTAQASVAQ
jgi:hypothetical protein